MCSYWSWLPNFCLWWLPRQSLRIQLCLGQMEFCAFRLSSRIINYLAFFLQTKTADTSILCHRSLYQNIWCPCTKTHHHCFACHLQLFQSTKHRLGCLNEDSNRRQSKLFTSARFAICYRESATKTRVE